MISPTSLRPGNWIYPTGRSKYVVVTGLLLGMMEKNEDFCKEFEGIELTGELLEAAGFKLNGFKQYELDLPKTYSCVERIFYFAGDYLYLEEPSQRRVNSDLIVLWNKDLMGKFFLHQLQNLYLDLTGSELSLPESALIIPEIIDK